MHVNIFQFNGCNKCFNESLLLKNDSQYDIEFISTPNNWKEEKIDVAVITGYLLPSDKKVLKKIQANSINIIAFGSCTTTGGVYGLANQKGGEITPIRRIVENTTEVHGCLAEIEELNLAIEGKFSNKLKKLCELCTRKPSCKYLDEVRRQIELDDNETCFNDLGFLCNGFIANECKERCINYGTPCRGCKSMVNRPGIRMLGMFGTLMGNIEVATEASKYGSTDKLADENDDVVESIPDIVGNFFRFSLPISGLPRGKIPSNGSILEDLFVGRLIEELPLITGLLGGINSISLTLKVIELYEKGAHIEVSKLTKKYRKQLHEFEKELKEAVAKEDASQYEIVCGKIRKIAGNMNLSNVFFGGFKTQIEDNDNFEDYKTHIFNVVEGTYKNGIINFSIDSKGIITKFRIKEEEI